MRPWVSWYTQARPSPKTKLWDQRDDSEKSTVALVPESSPFCNCVSSLVSTRDLLENRCLTLHCHHKILAAAFQAIWNYSYQNRELTDEHGPDYHAEVFRTCSEVSQDPPGPHHRVVNGLATAAGCQLVASCDIAVASDKSSFAMPGVNIGLFCSTPGVALGRAVLRKVALEVLFTGEPVSAREALLHGLLSRVVPEDETTQMAKKVASPDQPVLSLGKATLYGQLARDLRTACHLTSQVMVDNLGLPDAQEGVKAFLQKRKPVWSH
uniref:Enoyl-CoA hydratase domain-containing protein 3, mitochondrial n=1 Tax=Monodon monoceros TaxID=40151 RepID=A0A8C6FAJ5_MONMO